MVQAREPQLKAALFEVVEVGEELGPVEEVVTDHKVKSFAFTVDDYHPWYFGDSPFGGRIGHAALLANDLLYLYMTKYDPTTVLGLHTHEELWFHHPVFVGERVTLRARYVEKYVRREKGYIVTEAEATGHDGRLLLRRRGTEIMRVRPGDVVGRRTAEPPVRRVTGEYRRDVAPAAHARADLAPGTPIVPLIKQPRQDQVSVFSRIDQFYRNIHTDLELARAAGLTGPIIQSEMEVMYLAELLTSFFGAPWFTSGWLSTKFIHPVYVGETLAVRGVVTGRTETPGGIRLDLDLWVENAAGKMTVVGWASGLVAS